VDGKTSQAVFMPFQEEEEADVMDDIPKIDP